MSYQPRYQTFVFEGFEFDEKTATSKFHYSFDNEIKFTETAIFSGIVKNYSELTLNSALQLAFYVIGTSYYKTFPTIEVKFKTAQPDKWQAEFLQKVYTEGLSQFMFENNLTLQNMPKFGGEGEIRSNLSYAGEGILALQSGGKDSLLTAAILNENKKDFTSVYVSSTDHYPKILDKLSSKNIRLIKRQIDKANLVQAALEGGLNGHVPVTYIVEALALIDAVLHGENMVLASIGHEGEEPHEFIGDLPVNHQWSKTKAAEDLLINYVKNYISPYIKIGSPLRKYSELKIAELFVQKCWAKFGHSFSSCNVANYSQGAKNQKLKWCGRCPKCANSYLLFAPFVEPKELQSLFNNEDLFAVKELTETFKGLLGIEGVMKPFECVGETEELRLAYHMAIQKWGEELTKLPFNVPKSNFDYEKLHPVQNYLQLV